MTSDIEQQPSAGWPDAYEKIAAAFFSALPVIAVQAPRFLSLAPGLAGLALLFAYRYTHGKWPKLSCQAFGWMIGLAALMGVSSLWAVEPGVSFERALRMLPLFLSGALLFSVGGTLDGRAFRKFFPIGVAVAGILLCVDLFTGKMIYRVLHPNVASAFDVGTFSELNRGTVFYALCIFPALMCLNKNFKSPLFIALAIITGFVLQKTASQTAQLALLSGLIIYMVFPEKIKNLWIGLWAALAAGLLAMPWLAPIAFEKLLGTTALENSWMQNGYAGVRLEIWDFVARRVQESPWIGFGADSADHMVFDTSELYHKGNHIMHPHSFILQLWLEYGIFGPVFAAAFFGAVMWGLYKLDVSDRAAPLALLFATIVAAATSYDLWQAWWIGSFGLLFLFAMISQPQKKTPAM